MPTFNHDDPNFASLSQRYEDFVSSSPYGVFMQSMVWAKIKNTWNADYVYLEDENGNIKAAMSLVSISNDGGEFSFTYAPGAPVCDFSDRALVEELIREAEPVLQARRSFLLRISSYALWNQELVDLWEQSQYILRSRGVDPHDFANPRMEMKLDLRDLDLDDPLATFTSGVRNKMRKGEKRGVSSRYVTVDSPDYADVLDKFYDLTEIMSKRQGIKHRSLEYFDRMMRSFPDTKLWLTEHESGLPLASCLMVNYAGTANYVYAASSNDMTQTRPSFQMNYNALVQAKKDGMHTYNMGGIFAVDPENGLYNFKERICGPEGLREYIGELDVVKNQAKYDDFLNR
ncbi:lipid II:glycine glycyltransferase FemX [Arcanobacterium phocae]|uniref:lipid II:glycine glycyltransferase FemX n=1 Tax=Arcanobacterium phocae TaxID=131112 RepID=UPI001C0EDEA2|nr:peptidoglycan bridge formation glycyltransferase FemA/FemB family protein [Arcanobacterium phocae]